jgi:hypothetical protein
MASSIFLSNHSILINVSENHEKSQSPCPLVGAGKGVSQLS